MSFVCPDCSAGTLSIVCGIELPPDDRSDEITVQVVQCRPCRLKAVAVYQETRRGALDSESWSHTGYRVDAKTVEEVGRLIRACTDSRNARCRCRSHSALAGDGWKGMVADVDWRETFHLTR